MKLHWGFFLSVKHGENFVHFNAINAHNWTVNARISKQHLHFSVGFLVRIVSIDRTEMERASKTVNTLASACLIMVVRVACQQIKMVRCYGEKTT